MTGIGFPFPRRAALAVALVAALPLALHAQRDRGRDSGYRAEIDTTLAFTRQGTVDLTAIAGDIIVTGSDRSDVRIHATSERGMLRLDASSSRITLEVQRRNGHAGDARFDVSVPSGTRVLMRSTSGDLTATGVRGEVEAHTINGDIRVSDAARKVSVETISGDIALSGIDGDVQAQTVSGSVELRRVSGDVDLQSTSGDLSASQAVSTDVRMATVSGDVGYEGSVDATGRYDLRTHSGDVRVTVPRGAGATVHAESFSGSFESCVPVTLAPGSSLGQPKQIDFKVGDGSARVALQSFSGDLTIACAGSAPPSGK